MKASCDFNDYEIAGEYDDADKSGKTIEGHQICGNRTSEGTGIEITAELSGDSSCAKGFFWMVQGGTERGDKNHESGDM